DVSSPVILLGRGGSGTRLLSEMARELGVFLGTELNVSGDSLEWTDTVYKLAIEATVTGIESGSRDDLEWRETLRSLAARVLERGHVDPSQPWGWKLPETTLAIEVVLRAFPGARV